MLSNENLFVRFLTTRRVPVHTRMSVVPGGRVRGPRRYADGPGRYVRRSPRTRGGAAAYRVHTCFFMCPDSVVTDSEVTNHKWLTLTVLYLHHILSFSFIIFFFFWVLSCEACSTCNTSTLQRGGRRCRRRPHRRRRRRHRPPLLLLLQRH